MDATQAISDSFLESDEEEYEEEKRPLAKLCVLKNEHIPETELPLFLGENVLGRDSNFCTLPLPAPSVSKQHATICISVYRRKGFHDEEEIEALVWDLGSMNGTRKGRTKLTPNVRYALSERDSLVVADIPCQYVSCPVDTVSSQGDSRTLVSRNSGVKPRLPDALGEEGGDTSTGSTTRVNGGTEALPELEDTTKTPVRTGCLSFAPTPTQPEGTLVPESDVDSDGERGGGADRFKALVSDSDSHKSSPSCSTFLSPTNKTIPESEDESPITPCSAKNRSHKRVSFSMDETDVDLGRQQLKEKKALVIADDSEEEEDREEERAALKSEESVQHVPVKQERNVSLTGEDKSPVSRPALLMDAVPAFNMDSDTDVEGEEEGVASAGPVTLQTDQQADQPPNTAQFHMDSDTDVDEDDGALDKVPKPVPLAADNTKPPHVISVIQPEAITMDSDTDVDDDAAVSDAASKAQPVSFQSSDTADSAPSTQLKDFHLDSDTDVDEEEEKECGTMNTSSKTDGTPSRLDIEPIGPEAAPPAQHGLHSDSDTDNEGVPALCGPSAVSAVPESGTTADKGADLDILSDSDTDVEADSPLVVPFVVTTLSFAPDVTSEAPQSESDADTDVDESSVPPAGDAVSPAILSVSSNTNVEDEVDFRRAGEGQIPNLRRESTPGMLAPPHQNCSTPLQSSAEGQVDDMDTQAFLGPSSGPFRYAGAPAERLKALSSCSESQEDDHFAVDETQSFVLQTNAPEDHAKDSTHVFGLESSGDEKGEQSTRGGSFHLGLSDSSHLQGQTQALAMESTQAFVSADRGVNLEDTQAYAATLNAEITSLENDSNLEATQAYGDVEEPARCSVTSEKENQVDLALQATQAYISEPCSDSEDETDENERKDQASAETQPLDFPTSSTLAMAETQLMSAFKEEESVSSVLQVKPRPQSETEEKEEHGEAAHPQSVAETQPMHASDNEGSDDEDLILGPRKRKAKLLHLEEEQTQPLTSCETQPMHISVDETQPMATSGKEESDEEDSIPDPQKRKAKQLCIEEEQTQTLTNSELSAIGTQPLDPGKDGKSDEEDSIPGPRKRKAKPLQLEDEQTQSLTRPELSTVETQPICEGEQSDEEDSFPGPRKRKAKLLNPEEEETQSLTISQVSALETQPMVTCEDGESNEEDSTPGPRKRKARPLQIQEEETQPLTNSEASTVETQLLETKADLQPEKEQPEDVTSGVTVRGKRRTRTRLREEEEQAECSEPPKRQTRGKNKALPTTRGRRGKSRPDVDESEEEEEVEQAKRTRGKNTTRQRKADQEEDLERERKEKEEQERLQAENAERLRLEWETAEKETIEKERKEREEKERADRIQKEKEEQLDRERKEKEEKERLEHEKAEREERERLEREEKARREKERKEQEEKERLETAKRELEEKLEREAKEKEERERLEKEKQEKEAKEKQIKEQQERLEREAKEKEERERLEKEKQIKEQQENKPEAPTRGRRAARRTTATTELKQDEQDDDVPARRTRSRSNSSNSVSSERSAASVTTQENSRGRGRGKGAKRTSEPPQAATTRSSNRRRMVAAGPTEEDSNDISPQGVLSRSNSSNSLNSEISSCSLSSQSGRGRGGRQRGRGRKTETHSIPPNNSQSAENSAPKPIARGRKSRKAEESSYEDDKEKADSQQATTTRGRQRANASDSKPATADEEDPSNQEEGCANEESLPPKRNVRGRGQKAVKSETVEAAPAVSDGGEAKEKRKGRKRELEADTEDVSSSSSKIPKGKEKAQTTEGAKGESKDEIPVQANRRGRVSSSQVKNTKDPPTEEEMKEESEKMEEEGSVERRGRGRLSAVQKKKKEEQGESETPVHQDAHVEASEPQTPTSRASRKRRAPPDSSDAPKTPRSSSGSPAARGLLRPAGQTYKVLFTGVVDEEGERVLTHLGGSIAKGVTDMNFLVTDKVRRTLKFLCAVAKGVPIVTTHWLEKSGKAGSFLSHNAFIVKDPEQERKFNFSLQDSLRIASSQPLLQGYEIHVTKSVKPEPDQMKDIITCSGATFLSKMPSSHKPQTVVISCEEDWSLCAPALSASLPVVTAEFILTGILQQKLDFQTHSLSAPTSTSQPAGGRGRGRKK